MNWKPSVIDVFLGLSCKPHKISHPDFCNATGLKQHTVFEDLLWEWKKKHYKNNGAVSVRQAKCGTDTSKSLTNSFCSCIMAS